MGIYKHVVPFGIEVIFYASAQPTSYHGSLVIKVSDHSWRVINSSPVPLKTHRVGEGCMACLVSNYQSDLGEYYTTHQAMISEVPVDRKEGIGGLQFVDQAYPTHALLNSRPVSMLAHPYGGYSPIEGIRLQCLHGEDGRCHP
ncbi:hypothetical protein TNCV_558591 [Trichonephila clavipes]|nr:hypothetical protein TNCV_558591 [Trichonephila clavipes]